MIAQQHFNPPVKVYTPVNQPFSPVALLRNLREKVSLHAGDQLVDNIPEARKTLLLDYAIAQILRLNMHNPKWVVKHGTDLEKITFLDLYLTQGYKNTIQESHFALDAAGNTVCFNVKAFKVGNYLQNNDNKEHQVYTVLDVFSVAVIHQDRVKNVFGGHPRYLEFMSMKGYEAC